MSYNVPQLCLSDFPPHCYVGVSILEKKMTIYCTHSFFCQVCCYPHDIPGDVNLNHLFLDIIFWGDDVFLFSPLVFGSQSLSPVHFHGRGTSIHIIQNSFLRKDFLISPFIS
jgi:hypothetical protein